MKRKLPGKVLQGVPCVTEAGVYHLTLDGNAKAPEAIAFTRWVCHELLPTVRESLGYNAADVMKFIDDIAHQRTNFDIPVKTTTTVTTTLGAVKPLE